jgi:Cu+-exporting ATPase
MSFLKAIFGAKGPTAKDPVCGMRVDSGRAKWVSTHNGTTYYFCARGCKEAFDQKPEDFV